MCANYNDVLKRLKEERMKMSWTQNEISRYAHMSQGNYCKVEQGQRRLSYHEIKCLCDSNIDVYYIFTGQKSSSYYLEMLCDCSYAKALGLLRILSSIIEYCYAVEPSEFWKGMYQRVRFVQLLDVAQREKDNIIFAVRRFLNYRQQMMAELLGIDIKKLRSLENEQCLPDSELLWRLYIILHISPAVVLKDRKGVLCEMGGLMESMSSEAEKGVFRSVFEITEVLKKDY